MQTLTAADFANVTETADAPANASTGYAMSVGDSFSGSLSFAGDRDWVRVQLTAGQVYQFGLTGGSLLDPYLRLYDSSGVLIAQNDDGAGSYDSLLVGSVATSGTYYLSAGAYGDIGTGSYTLSVNLADNAETWTVAEVADYLTTGYWTDTGRAPRSFDASPGDSLTVNLSGLTASGRALAEQALLAWTYVLGITFTEVADAADITFDDAEAGASASTITSGNKILSAQVNVSTGWLSANGTSLDSYSFQTYIHEIGHALGLGHAGSYNGGAVYGIDNLYANDSWQMSVMSYFDQSQNTAVDASFAYLVTPMIADIRAIQDLYGTAGTIRTGSDVYGFNSTAGGYYDLISNMAQPVAFTILDDGGIDTIDASGSASAQRIDLRPGRISDFDGLTGNLVIARGTLIENAIGGSGADTLTGNSASNQLTGNSGDDWLEGRAAGDTLSGGAGLDYLRGGSGDDTLSGGGSRDILRGGAGDDALLGGAGNDQIKGAWGNDILTGGTGADVFKFKPGFGDDVITDFEDGIDGIRIVAGAADFGDLAITDTGPDTLIAFADVTILLEGIAPGAIGADDFIFG